MNRELEERIDQLGRRLRGITSSINLLLNEIRSTVPIAEVDKNITEMRDTIDTAESITSVWYQYAMDLDDELRQVAEYVNMPDLEGFYDNLQKYRIALLNSME